MFFRRPRSLMERIFHGPSNSDILNEITEPIQRHIYQMPIGGLATLPGVGHLRHLPSSLFRVSNLTLLAKRHLQIHRLLKNPKLVSNAMKQAGLHDVYLVGTPERWSRLLTGRLHSECSLYCEGHFYFLAKEDKAALIAKDFQCSDPDDLNQRTLSPLIAYHFGKTDYAPAQIRCIARWVVAEMSQLSFCSKNDGHFVSALAIRIICTPRSSTVFIGKCSQIWAQDRWLATVGSQLLIPNGFHTGYMIVGPNENAHGGCARQGRIFRVETAARYLAGCWTKGLLGQISLPLPEAHAAGASARGEVHVNYGQSNTTEGYLRALGGSNSIKTIDHNLERWMCCPVLTGKGPVGRSSLAFVKVRITGVLMDFECPIDPI